MDFEDMHKTTSLMQYGVQQKEWSWYHYLENVYESGNSWGQIGNGTYNNQEYISDYLNRPMMEALNCILYPAVYKSPEAFTATPSEQTEYQFSSEEALYSTFNHAFYQSTMLNNHESSTNTNNKHSKIEQPLPKENGEYQNSHQFDLELGTMDQKLNQGLSVCLDYNSETTERSNMSSKHPILTSLLQTHVTVHPLMSENLVNSLFECPSGSTFENHFENKPEFTQNDCTICKKNLQLDKFYSSYSEKYYICPVCQRVFSLESQLATHMRIHSDKHPFQCKACMKRFKKKSYLALHEKRHDVKKQYKCEFCKKEFYTMQERNQHKKRRNGENSCVLSINNFLINSNYNV